MSNESNVSQSVTAFDMCATSGTNVAQFYLYFKYKSVYVHENSSNEPNVPQSVPHLIFVPQVPQMWHKMWHNSVWMCNLGKMKKEERMRELWYNVQGLKILYYFV